MMEQEETCLSRSGSFGEDFRHGPDDEAQQDGELLIAGYGKCTADDEDEVV